MHPFLSARVSSIISTKPVLLFGHVTPFVGCMTASAGHSSSLFRSQAMQPPSSVQGLRRKAAIGAVQTMEETLRVLTINELMRLTRTELCSLAAQITVKLSTFRAGSPQRTTAYVNLRNIRAVLARRDFSL
ncbi:MAG: hypothetical protein ACRD3S_17210 [Terracidiphilus sp.]